MHVTFNFHFTQMATVLELGVKLLGSQLGCVAAAELTIGLGSREAVDGGGRSLPFSNEG